MAKGNGASPPPVVQVRDLSKTYTPGCDDCAVLRGVDLDIHAGEFVVLLGVSGSGKSTLLNLISGLDQPTGGSVHIEGTEITALSEHDRTIFRRNRIGIVFQFFNLIPTLTALENVALPIQFARNRKFNPTRRARELLTLLGLDDRMHHRPSQLSGGQQQRVALARALANNPPLLLCDEPTGNLDTASSAIVMDALRDVQQQTGTTVIIVTHDMDVASQCDRVITLVDGRIAEDVDPRSSAQMAAVKMLRDKRATGEMRKLDVEEVQ